MLFPFLHLSLLSVVRLSAFQHHQLISAERPLRLSLRACTSKMEPFQLDTMLFFPPELKICASVETNKGAAALARDTRRTTFLNASVQLWLRPVGSAQHCTVEYTGYQGEYRFAPDLGYYQPCQRSIALLIERLVEADERGGDRGNSSNEHMKQGRHRQNQWWPIDQQSDANSATAGNPNCPIRALPGTIRSLNACQLQAGHWYELAFRSAIHFEQLLPARRLYQQHWANHSSTFVFKPEREVWRNGSELSWLQRLLQLRVKMKNCEAVRYLIRLDEQWPAVPLPVTVFIDYQVRENAYVKHARHLGNGTLLDGWFTGTFPVWRTPDLRTHELCVRFAWPRSLNRHRICRVFMHGRSSLDCDPLSYYNLYTTVVAGDRAISLPPIPYRHFPTATSLPAITLPAVSLPAISLPPFPY
ncbi:hypothetical protein niasHT_004209 [Heterodera trifolii]|uniref:Uncharacterized protein n=1 Tax=Heterodera trifolii TaxID=157864 RepID=A0ABD2ME17_9BILA